MNDDAPSPAANLAELKSQRSAAQAEVKLLTIEKDPTSRRIIHERLERFAGVMRQALQSGDPAFRCSYLHLFVDAINAAFPEAQAQTCIILLLHRSPSYISWANRREMVAALTPKYQVPTVEAARAMRDDPVARRASECRSARCG